MPSATLPNTVAANKLETLAAKLIEAASDFRAGVNTTPQNHAKLVDTLRSTIEVVNRPSDDLNDMMMSFVQCTAIRLLFEWKVFEHIPAEGTISYKDLAANVSGDENLIMRLCWLLNSVGILRQEGADQVAHTPRSLPYSSLNPLSAMLMIGFDEYLSSFQHMPRYFDTYGAKEPSGRLHSIKAFAEGKPELTATEIMYAQPERVKNMTLAMSSMEGLYPLAGVYDYNWVAAAKDADPSRALIVDVGGAKGHTLDAICKQTPGLPIERCVLQDLPEVIDHAKGTVVGPQLIGMDFFNEQPTKGGMLYIIRRCLHDFSDDECIQILTHLSNAMAPDSRLLIGETVLSNPPSRPTAMVDLLLSTIGGKERTVEGFNKVAERTGLKLLGVHKASFGDFAMIEYGKA